MVYYVTSMNALSICSVVFVMRGYFLTLFTNEKDDLHLTWRKCMSKKTKVCQQVLFVKHNVKLSSHIY